MDTQRHPYSLVSICFYLVGGILIGLIVTSCGSQTTPTPFFTPVTSPASTPEQFSATPVSIIPAVPTSTPACRDNLTFVSDVTIPDGTLAAPGGLLDKQWLVQNSGDCNWNVSYRLRLISGNSLGASTEQALFPARAGTQATLRILFTAPQENGEYVSEWQAFNPNGIAFGESFFIKIEVKQ